MGHEMAPSLLGPFLMVAIIENGGCEGASDGEKYEPVAGGEFELESGKSWSHDETAVFSRRKWKYNTIRTHHSKGWILDSLGAR